MLSLLFGYRDRDPWRLEACLKSLLNQENAPEYEVIVADYGSSDSYAKEVQALLATFPASFEYHYAPTQGQPWNRSQALNLAALKASGSTFVFGDIDLVYPPNFLATISQTVQPGTKYNYRCRYLPEGETHTDYAALHALHPTAPLSADTGLGLTVIPRGVYERIGGYDERFMVWGVEDIAFHYQAERLSIPTAWIDDAQVCTYHIWHPTVTRDFIRDLYPTLWALYESTRNTAPARYATWESLQNRPLLGSRLAETGQVFFLGNDALAQTHLLSAALAAAAPGTKLVLKAERLQLSANPLIKRINGWLATAKFGYRLQPMQYTDRMFEEDGRYYAALFYFLLFNRAHLQDFYWQEEPAQFALHLIKK